MKIKFVYIIIIVAIVAVFFCILFVYLGFKGIKGDLAGWVQSGIAVIEIPIIIYGVFKILMKI